MSMQPDDDLIEDVPREALKKQRASDDDVEVPEELEQWKQETKGVQRIIWVAITEPKPRTAEWIAEQALVSEQTARDHLKTFVDVGIVASFTSSGVTRYHADEGFLHYREVSRYTEEYSEEELTSHIEDIEAQIADIEEEYDVDGPDELRRKASTDGVSAKEIREYKKAASELAELRDQLAVIKDSLRRYSKFQTKKVIA